MVDVGFDRQTEFPGSLPVIVGMRVFPGYSFAIHRKETGNGIPDEGHPRVASYAFDLLIGRRKHRPVKLDCLMVHAKGPKLESVLDKEGEVFQRGGENVRAREKPEESLRRKQLPRQSSLRLSTHFQLTEVSFPTSRAAVLRLMRRGVYFSGIAEEIVVSRVKILYLFAQGRIERRIGDDGRVEPWHWPFLAGIGSC